MLNFRILNFIDFKLFVLVSKRDKSQYYTSGLSPILFHHIFVIENTKSFVSQVRFCCRCFTLKFACDVKFHCTSNLILNML